MKIFIIDDDKDFSECVSRIVSEGNEVFCFTNCIEVISELSEELPDLIFLDILLTGPDGFTLLHELQSYKDTAAIPIVVLSNTRIEEDLREYGVVAVFEKTKVLPEEIKASLGYGLKD